MCLSSKLFGTGNDGGDFSASQEGYVARLFPSNKEKESINGGNKPHYGSPDQSV